MDHGMRVLSGILPNRRDNLHYAFQHIAPEHFRSEQLRVIWNLTEHYYNLTAGLLPPQVLSDLLERKGTEPAKAILLEQTLQEIIETPIEDDQFRYSIDALRDIREQQLTGESIATGFEILERGIKLPGEIEERKGHRHAREYLYSELGHIDRLGNAESAPEGDMRLETKEMLEDYATRKSGKFVAGVMTGIPALDRATAGHQKGDLALYCAYTSQGKSMLSAQLGWHAAVEQGKNVFLATSETVRAQYMRRLAARHSRQPQFGAPEGIDTTDIKNGTLSVGDEEIYRAVLDDLRTNPNYGKLYVTQIPRDATMAFLEARLSRQQQLWHIDLVVIDYLNLIKPSTKRQSSREEANDIIKDAKLLATSFNRGEGVPVVSPWQMSQTAFRNATGTDGRSGTGLYGLTSLADTSEAEKSADLLVTLLRYPETPKKAKLQVLKARDSDIPPPMDLDVDFRCAFLGEQSVGFGESSSEYGL